MAEVNGNTRRQRVQHTNGRNREVKKKNCIQFNLLYKNAPHVHGVEAKNPFTVSNLHG